MPGDSVLAGWWSTKTLRTRTLGLWTANLGVQGVRCVRKRWFYHCPETSSCQNRLMRIQICVLPSAPARAVRRCPHKRANIAGSPCSGVWSLSQATAWRTSRWSFWTWRRMWRTWEYQFFVLELRLWKGQDTSVKLMLPTLFWFKLGVSHFPLAASWQILWPCKVPTKHAVPCGKFLSESEGCRDCAMAWWWCYIRRWNSDSGVCAGSHKVSVAVFACGILPVNSRMEFLLCRVHMHFDCAGSRKLWVAVRGSIWSAAFYLSMLA